MSDNKIRLIISGKEFTGFTGATISMAISQVADAFSVEAPFDSDNSQLVKTLKPYGYQKFQLYLDTDLLMTGRIEDVHTTCSASGNMLNIQGRSLTGVLVDCPVTTGTEYTGLTLSQIANRICKPYAVSVRADADSAVIDEARCEYGDTVSDFLVKLATVRNLLINSSFDGRLVISSGKAFSTGVPVARFAEGDGYILSCDADFNGTKRFSEYRCATQFAGSEDIVGKAADSGVSIFRPTWEKLTDTDKDPSVTAKVMRSYAFASSCAVNATVSGWLRPDGKRWAERKIISLKYPSAMLYKEQDWLIDSVRLTLTADDGMLTTLGLVPPETYSGKMPEAYAWS